MSIVSSAASAANAAPGAAIALSPLAEAASLHPILAAAGPADIPVREGVLTLADAMPLHFGGRLDRPVVAWRLTGPAQAPVIVALGGISSGRIVADAGGEKGWWSEIAGVGRALDPRRWRILGIDFLGGCGRSTGPRPGQTNFPSISAYDQAGALRRVVEHLQLGAVAALVGASYGGMAALAFAERWPALVERIVVISAAHRAHPMASAWRCVQRALVRYAISRGDGPEGLRLARALAMATYRSPQEFAARFDAPPTRVDGRFQFAVESYLLARGDAYAAIHLAEAFVCLSESIDLHQIDPARIRTPATLVGVCEDQLVPLADMRSLKERLAGPAELIELSSIYGHDAFLKEAAAFEQVFARALGAGAQ